MTFLLFMEFSKISSNIYKFPPYRRLEVTVPLHAGHQRVHGDPHPGGLRQHQDVRHGRGVRGGHQHQQQAGPDSTDYGSLSRQV